MVARPTHLEMAYIRALGAVAVAVASPNGGGLPLVFFSRDPWTRAQMLRCEIVSLYWYADARRADQAAQVFKQRLPEGVPSDEIARLAHDRKNARPVRHAQMLAMARGTIEEIEKAIQSADKREINRRYREHRLAAWAANKPAVAYEAFLDDLREKAIRRALGARSDKS